MQLPRVSKVNEKLPRNPKAEVILESLDTNAIKCVHI